MTTSDNILELLLKEKGYTLADLNRLSETKRFTATELAEEKQSLTKLNFKYENLT